MSSDELTIPELLAWLYDFTPTSPVPKDFAWRTVRLMQHMHARLDANANDEELH